MEEVEVFSPLEGLSEYRVQNTQAGHSCPLGPRTMPGGTSSSFLSVEVAVAVDDGGGDDLEERSTGSELLAAVVLFLVAAAGGEILGQATEDEVERALEGRRGLLVVIGGVARGGVAAGNVLAGLVLGGI